MSRLLEKVNATNFLPIAAVICSRLQALPLPVIRYGSWLVPVYPFATTVAEQFGKKGNFKTPVVESTGSGGGLKLFCSGVGVETPDITNASRRIKMSEVKKCQKNGVTGITEVKVGYDGIVMANSKASTKLSLTRKQIYLALGKTVGVPMVSLLRT